MRKAFVAGLFVLVLFTPAVSFAAGLNGPLVPGNTAVSAGPGSSESQGTDYTLCDLLKLANNVINFAVSLSVLVATLMFAYGGVLYVTGASGGEAQIKKAHEILLNAILGILIILLSWLLVNIVVSVLTTQSVDFWTGWFQGCPSNSINTAAGQSGSPSTPATVAASAFPPASLANTSCVATSQALAAQTSATSNCNATAQLATDQQNITNTANAIKNNQTYSNAIQQCSSQEHVPQSVYVALAGLETGGHSTGPQSYDPANNGATTCVGGYGVAGVSCQEAQTYCSTAGQGQSYCKGIVGGSNSYIVGQLQNNDTLNFCAGGNAINTLYNQYSQSYAIAAVAYNGGPGGALAPSVNCPGYLQMQCPVASASVSNPYCRVTCAYGDAFNNYVTNTGGTSMDIEKEFEAYRAVAEAGNTTP